MLFHSAQSLDALGQRIAGGTQVVELCCIGCTLCLELAELCLGRLAFGSVSVDFRLVLVRAVLCVCIPLFKVSGSLFIILYLFGNRIAAAALGVLCVFNDRNANAHVGALGFKGAQIVKRLRDLLLKSFFLGSALGLLGSFFLLHTLYFLDLSLECGYVPILCFDLAVRRINRLLCGLDRLLGSLYHLGHVDNVALTHLEITVIIVIFRGLRAYLIKKLLGLQLVGL